MEEVRPNTAREELISKLYKKNIRLSYSTLKNFTSPVNLVNYKLKKYSQSPSMLFGSLCDVLLLTPENFDKEYKVIDKIPTSDLQISFADSLVELMKNESELTEEVIKVQYDMFYKTGKPEKTYNMLEDYIIAKANGKSLITQDLLDEANLVCENLMMNKDIQSLFSQMKESQMEVRWNDKGWDFIGFLDMYLDGHIIDLKFSKDSNPEKFERDINNFDYFLQAAMYCKALREMGVCDNPRYSFIVYDKSYNYSVIQLDYSYIKYGERKYKYLLQELNRCIDENKFDESYGFFKRSYVAYKPKWSRGFELKED
ncbi:RecE [Olleya phage Harreka_1]|uniref:RecE n=1 Tax=Olleya phage Harreka_1 TaxID=2745673 RepID=A0A8E5E9H2_9CAUD|nr:RecE [Olleya phage Harreka_1]QQV90443.1 RecE [Olleya phage Harreka_1]